MYAIVYPWVNIVVVSIASPLTITGARIALAGLLLALGKLEHAWANQKYCQTSVRIRSPDRRPRAGSILGETGPTNPMLGAPGPIGALGRGVNSVIWGVGVIMYAIVYPVLVELPRDIFVGIMKACMGQNRNRVQNRSDFGPPPGPPTSGLVDLG